MTASSTAPSRRETPRGDVHDIRTLTSTGPIPIPVATTDATEESGPTTPRRSHGAR